MIKKIGLVVALLGSRCCDRDVPARRLRARPNPNEAFTPRTGASETDRIADLERALAAQVDRSNLLAEPPG